MPSHSLAFAKPKVQSLLFLTGSLWKGWGGRISSQPQRRGIRSCLSPLCAFTTHVQDRMAKRIHARRLEGVDENIWVEFVSLANQYKTVNLGQGFPDFSPPSYLREAFSKAVTDEHTLLNQYTRAFGHPPLVKALAQLFGPLFGQELNPLTNIMVSVGAYGALFSTFQALVDKGDEVIIIEPFFDSYEPMTLMAGGQCVFVSLRPKPADGGKPLNSGDWRLDLAELEAKINKNTKMLVLNTPNNPLGKVFNKEELEEIANICVKYDLLCVSDEVYEWLVYDGNQHVRIASLPGMWERTVTIGSAGKTFSATGWKVGWALGPDCLLKHLRTVHQNSVYHCATGAQEAVAQGFQKELERLGKPECYFVQLRDELQKKRDRLYGCLTEVGMKPVMSQGSYFMIADISVFKSEVPPPTDQNVPYDHYFTKWMMKHKQLAAIPMSAFYSGPHKKQFENYLRFCFVKEDATLEAAEKILQKWSRESSGRH
ncbi:kynurenine--oxoglutarate transaminase 1 isoform X2 [Bufo bufo]|uniref:kynurenine--oxoglutarate transaminase 1 isoform X2 n=1 Tax=Bufo bufo TaxID=8384 RepID=UPI001ABE40F6|nr:kynurenine--oxoglutarate transaminase 1 isoform X2 [Bufo bufo]